MTKAQEAALAKELKNDIQTKGPKAFHDHVAKAILQRVSDDDIRTAIRENEEDLRAAYKKETGEELNVDEWIANELDQQHFMALFADLGDDEIED